MAWPTTEELEPIIEAAFGADLTADPGTWSYTDLSSRLMRRPVNIGTGRRDGQKTMATGACEFWLSNTDGALTPTHPMSTYYPNVVLNTPFRFSVNNVGASPPHRLFCGYLAAVQPVVIPAADGNNISAVRIVIAGISRRLESGTRAKSAMRRTILGATAEQPDAYWAMEDGPDSYLAGSALAGGVPLAPDDITTLVPRTSFAPKGGSSAWDFSGGGQLFADLSKTIPAANVASWELEAVVGMDYDYSGDDIRTALGVTTGLATGFTGFGFCIFQTSGVQHWGYFYAVDGTGALNNSSLNSVTLVDSSRTAHLRLKLVDGESGGVGFHFYVNGVLSQVSGAANGPLYAPQSIKVNVNDQQFDASPANLSSMSQVALWVPARSTAETYLAADGYAGEAAHDRVTRVCEEEGIPAVIVGSNSTTMGPQAPDTVMGVLRDCEKADFAFLYEQLDDFGIGFRCGETLYNQSAGLAIDLSTYRTTKGTQAEVLAAIYDDQGVRNEWTANRSDGSEATASNAPSAFEVYDDQTDVNVELDSQLPNWAGWAVATDSVVALRYPTAPIDLGANPTMVDDWLALSLGDVIEWTNAPAQYPPGPVSRLLQGYSQSIAHKSWTVKTTGRHADTYQVGVYATDPGGRPPDRYGVPDCYLYAAIGSTGGPLVVRPGNKRWSTTAGHYSPNRMLVTLGGETIRISGVSNLAAYVAAGTAAAASAANVSPGLPAGLAAADVMFLVAARRGTGTFSTPSGWTVVSSDLSNLVLFRRTATSSESSPTVSPVSPVANETIIAQIFAFRGVAAETAEQLTTGINVSTSTNIAVGSTGAARDSSVILLAAMKTDDWTSATPPTDFTEASEASSTLGDDMAIYVAYQIQTAKVGIASGTITGTGGSATASRYLYASVRGLQSMTVLDRSVNGVVKSHAAGFTEVSRVALTQPATYAY